MATALQLLGPPWTEAEDDLVELFEYIAQHGSPVNARGKGALGFEP